MANLELRGVVKRFGAAEVIHGVAEHLGGETFVYVALPSGETVTVDPWADGRSARRDGWHRGAGRRLACLRR